MKASSLLRLKVAIVGAVVLCQSTLAVTGIETVAVGNPGNANDDTGFGAVSRTYRIAIHEVTNAQYTEFLNAVDPTGSNSLSLYSGNMASHALGGINFSVAGTDGAKYSVKPGRDRNPVNYVSWYDAARFTNWLHNGEGMSSTEVGAYTLLGETAIPSNGLAITRETNAEWFLPSENEWYKAAHHKNDGITGNYWDYATSTDTEPFSDQPPGTKAPDQSNTANFFKEDFDTSTYDRGYAVTGSPAYILAQNYLTDVGAYTFASSPYGTFDQAGNLWEWNEDGSFARGARGGFWSSRAVNLSTSRRSALDPAGEWNDVGFRVATVPEPSSSVVFLGLVCPAMLRILRVPKRF